MLVKNITNQLKIHKTFNSKLKEIMKQYPMSEILISQILIYQKIILMKSHLPKEISDHIAMIKNKNRRVIFSKNFGSQASQIEKYMFGTQCCTF